MNNLDNHPLSAIAGEQAHHKLPFKALNDNETVRGISYLRYGDYSFAEEVAVFYNDESAANAKFVERACNAHYDLINAIEYALKSHSVKSDIALSETLEMALRKAKGEL